MAEKLVVELDLETGDISTAFGKVEKKAQQSGKKSGSAFGKTFQGAISSFIGNVASQAFTNAVSKIKGELNGAVEAAKNLEIIETQFKTILKTTDAAQKQIKELQDFAATTPFQLNGLALATRQLLSFGVAQQDIIPTLRQIGDLAAGTGSRIDELTIPFGRLISTQKLTLVELDKFADRGINLYGKLAKQTGISIKDIRDEISKGRVPFAEFTKALGDLTSKGGLFFGATEKQSKTLAGTLSTLNDNVQGLRGNLGKLFAPFLKKAAESQIKSIQELNKTINNISFEQVVIQFKKFNDGVITFLVAPLEVFLNASNVIFKAIVSGFNGILATVALVVEGYAELLSLAGVEIPAGVKKLTDATQDAFTQSAFDTEKAFNAIYDFPISDKLSQQNEELAASLSETEQILDQAADNQKKPLNKVVKNIDDTQKKVNTIINNSLARGISGGIQNIVKSIQAGENVFENFGKFLLTTFGDLAITLGEFFILKGLATQSLLAISPPAATIAAGAALVALGSILKGAAGGGGGGGGGASAGGGAAEPAAGGLQPVTFQDEQDLETEPQTNVSVTIQGDVLDSEQSGTRIAEILSESFGKQGIVLSDARFA